MKITKYEHACIVIEESFDSAQGKKVSKLVIDPGEFSTSFKNFKNVDVLVITHAHADHFSPEKVTAIARANPGLAIFSVQEVIDQIKELSTTPVSAGSEVTKDSFNLKFSGGKHATIHESIDPIENLAVMVNDYLFYPGDSFTLPRGKIPVLAIPISAPWMKIAEAMDYLLAVKPGHAFPVHEAVLSDSGYDIHNRLLSSVAIDAETSYSLIKVGETVNL